MLVARADDDPFRRHPHAPAFIKMVGNGTPQLRCAAKIHRPQNLLPLLGHDRPHGLDPDGERKGHVLPAAATQVQQGLLGRRFRFRRQRYGGRTCRVSNGADIDAAAFHRSGVALGNELGIGCLHRDDPHPQIGRQGSFGGQTIPGLQDASGNIRPDVTVERGIEALAPVLFQSVCQHNLILLNIIFLVLLIIPVWSIIVLSQKSKRRTP